MGAGAKGATSSAQPTSASARPLTEDSLDLHFRALAAGLEEEGLARGPLLERGFLPPSGRAAYPVHIAANECALFVAVATASMADLDASLFTAEGSALVEDDSTSSRPTLTFCASSRAPVDGYLALHAYQGAGSFVAAQFRRALREGDDLRTAIDARTISALGQLAQTLHERGFEDAAPRVNLPLGDARPVRMAVNVAAGECYTLAAEGGDGLAEVGLRLVDSAGGELAHGLGEPTRGAPQLAALQYCADQRAELALEVVAMRGQGIARIARFRAAQVLVGGTRALWLGEPTPSAAAWASAKASSAPTTPLSARADDPHVSPGKLAFSSEQVALHQGEVLELAPKRARGQCERWQAELLPGLARATLRIEGERGELLSEADSEHMVACTVVCATDTLRRISLVGRAGFGTLTLTGTVVDRRAEALDATADAQVSGAPAAARTRCSMSSGRR
jgi:hypothetical protein